MTIPEDEQGVGAADSGDSSQHTPDDDGSIPFMQRLMDNPFLLLFIGVAMPAVLYLVWGVIEISQIPIAN